MGNTKIGFNNFKAFGPKMQYFTKKPLTLIYGPNSIGKSSLLHSQLLSYYSFKNAGNNYNFYKNSFAGDELDLGGFDSFIHKHDDSSSITYEYIINEKNDLLSVFNIGNLLGCEILDEYTNLEYINEKLESNYNKTGIKFKYILASAVISYKFRLEEEYGKYSNENELNTQRENVKSYDFINYEKALCEYYDNVSIENISQEHATLFLDIFNEAEKQFEDSIDPLDNILKEALQLNPLDIIERLKFFKVLNEVSEIKVTNILSKDGFSKFTIKIDDEILFEDNGTDIYLNEQNYYLSNSNQLSNKLEIYVPPLNVFKEYVDFHFNLLLISLRTINQKSNIQYFGPLRHYPERFELYNIDDLKEKPASKLAKFIDSIMNWVLSSHDKLILFIILLPLPALYYRIFISSVPFYGFDVIELLLLMPFSFIAFYGLYRTIIKSDFGKEKLNKVLPKRFRLLRDKVISSYDAWKILSQSSDTVNKLNEWLGDDKLKNNYSIKVVKKPINSLGISVRNVAKTFGAENAIGLYDSSWDNNKILQSIIDIWNKIERKLNIQQRYESQVIFTDLAKNTEVTPRDMGLGISQILPILISVFNSKNTALFLEQPELHLHPAVQMELADEFIRSANEQYNDFMIETHSEHLLLRIMKRMRQTADGTLEDESLRLTPDDVCLLYVNNNGHITYIKELELDYDGTLLDQWPNGFFEEGHRERFDA